MDERSDRIADKVQALSDIELATLLCLITDQHCIIEGDRQSLDKLDQEIRLVARNVFELTWAVLECSESTTVDEFCTGILVEESAGDYFSVANEDPRDDDLSYAARAGSPKKSNGRHQIEDGFPNLEELQGVEPIYEDNASTSSIVRSPPEALEKREGSVIFTEADLNELSSLITKVSISTEVRAYLHNIVVFMRLHRAVGGGISAMATRHFDLLSQ
ncbi:uncharacterized protein N0V89_003593 [Didymosphaeria variabile]|uniref:Uncharacterized protein n=1 Tax=Didymosphaeria variabile TaxID=1932322 RepID=A0A9W8XMX6_9PLEO|nr:uncharacterized protein N0V89_003593 [Didymosphaeria variabile]KAJ4355573.1 hypothetical protein N0V89_003593 [Didymosphaeria variabile]